MTTKTQNLRGLVICLHLRCNGRERFHQFKRAGEKRRVGSSKLEGALAPFAEMGFEGAIGPFADICEKGEFGYLYGHLDMWAFVCIWDLHL